MVNDQLVILGRNFLPYEQRKNVITARKRSLGQGNMFTGVCLSTGGGACSGGFLVPGGACSGRVPGPGGCLVRGVYLLRGGLWSGGGVWSGGSGLGGAWWRPPAMATAAGSMHPTGMHS